MTLDKKKKKPLLQEQEQVGSEEYLANREIDQIIKRGKDRLKHAITLSDEKLTKTKKQIVREMATEMEKVGYPTNQICDRLTKSIKGLVSERTVRDALDAKYKNTEQMEVAKMQQNYRGGSSFHQQEQLKNKDIKEYTREDIKLINNIAILRKVAKHQMERADWFEQQLKQQQSPITPPDPVTMEKFKAMVMRNASIKELMAFVGGYIKRTNKLK